MGRLTDNQYQINISIEKMKKYGFRYDRSFECYTYIFPVYKYKGIIPIIYCKLGVNEETKNVWINVYDDNDRFYASYYNDENYKNTTINDIEKAITKELNKLSITRVG